MLEYLSKVALIDPAAARLALREMLGFALALKMRPTATPPGALP
jgi:hypothetical protein